ncbi:MAG: hypothetical protein ACRDOI_29630 [Trebonia sp.]
MPGRVITADHAPRRHGRPGHDLEAVPRVAVEVFNERGYDGRLPPLLTSS